MFRQDFFIFYLPTLVAGHEEFAVSLIKVFFLFFLPRNYRTISRYAWIALKMGQLVRVLPDFTAMLGSVCPSVALDDSVGPKVSIAGFLERVVHL